MRRWERWMRRWWLMLGMLCVACGATAESPAPAPPNAATTPEAPAADSSSTLKLWDGSGAPCPSVAAPLRGPIVFVSLGNLWLMQPDGTDRHALTNVVLNTALSDPQWSPDGQTLAFTVNQPAADRALSWLPVARICALNRHTGAGRVLAEAPTAIDSLIEPSWSADGASLLVTELITQIDGAQQYVGAKRTLIRITLASGERTVLVPDGTQGHVASNGQTLAYVDRRDAARVVLAGVDGQNAQILPLPAFADITWPTWAPSNQLVVMATSGAPATRSPSLPPIVERLLGVTPVAAHGLPADLWLWDVAEQQARALTTQGIDEPRMTWSPDGQSILYTAGLAGGVYQIALTGGPPKQLSPIGDYGGISWARK